MQIHYFANQVYQYSNAIPLYKEIDGIFIVKKTKRSIQFIKYFRNGNFSPNHRSFLNTPPYEKISKNEIPNLTGALISLSNYAIHHDSNRLKTIFIGHGSGDKKYGSKFRSLETYDYHFLSGPKHLEKLKDMGLNIPEEKLIKIGNLRFDDYLNGKIDKDQVLNRLGIKDKSRKNILYAPTWKWGDGTLLTYAKPFAEELTKEHNLIIRPHHHDRIHIRKLKIWTILNNLKHVYFSNPAAVITSDTMYDFKVSDLLISDTSSILYEYLITGNPIIVIQNQYKDLHTMPDDLNIMKHVSMFTGSESILDMVNRDLSKTTSRDTYNTLLNNCFYFNDGNSVDRAKKFIESIQWL